MSDHHYLIGGVTNAHRRRTALTTCRGVCPKLPVYPAFDDCIRPISIGCCATRLRPVFPAADRATAGRSPLVKLANTLAAVCFGSGVGTIGSSTASGAYGASGAGFSVVRNAVPQPKMLGQF